jgi:hypothetical protein
MWEEFFSRDIEKENMYLNALPALEIDTLMLDKRQSKNLHKVNGCRPNGKFKHFLE